MKSINTSTLWRLIDFLKPKRFQYFTALIVMAAIATAERVYTGWIVKLFVDAIAAKNLALLWNSVVYWGLFALGMVIITPIFAYAWRASIVQGVANLRQALYTQLQRLPLGYYEGRHSGDALSLLTNDVTAAEAAYQEHLQALVQSLLQMVSAAAFMLILKWDLALLIILSGVAPLLINASFAGRLRLIGQVTQEKLGVVSERLSDLLAGFQIVRTFSLADWILDRFKKGNQDVLEVSLKRVRIESSLAAANELSGLLLIASFSFGAYLVLTGRTSLGTLFALIQLNNPVQNCFLTLGSTIANIQGALAAGDRILSVLDAPPEPESYPPARRMAISAAAPSAVAAQEADPNQIVTFEDVRFHYSDGRPVLQGLSCAIRHGQVAAFVGPSGGGKSTIFRLLMGYYPALSGEISLFGHPVSAYTLGRLRDLFAFVPQDAFLYSGSVLENIRYGKMDATQEEVIAAARASNAHDFILSLPNGYDTLVGERGARLSGGQRQRIAIARALLKNAPILLLDEATSALDSESEELVQQALAVLMQGRTTLAIAHRLSTIENADIIFVIENGRLVEQGRHQELLEKGGLYRGLYERQFRDAGEQVISG